MPLDDQFPPTWDNVPEHLKMAVVHRHCQKEESAAEADLAELLSESPHRVLRIWVPCCPICQKPTFNEVGGIKNVEMEPNSLLWKRVRLQNLVQVKISTGFLTKACVPCTNREHRLRDRVTKYLRHCENPEAWAVYYWLIARGSGLVNFHEHETLNFGLPRDEPPHVDVFMRLMSDGWRARAGTLWEHYVNIDTPAVCLKHPAMLHETPFTSLEQWNKRAGLWTKRPAPVIEPPPEPLITKDVVLDSETTHQPDRNAETADEVLDSETTYQLAHNAQATNEDAEDADYEDYQSDDGECEEVQVLPISARRMTRSQLDKHHEGVAWEQIKDKPGKGCTLRSANYIVVRGVCVDEERKVARIGVRRAGTAREELVPLRSVHQLMRSGQSILRSAQQLLREHQQAAPVPDAETEAIAAEGGDEPAADQGIAKSPTKQPAPTIEPETTRTAAKRKRGAAEDDGVATAAASPTKRPRREPSTATAPELLPDVATTGLEVPARHSTAKDGLPASPATTPQSTQTYQDAGGAQDPAGEGDDDDDKFDECNRGCFHRRSTTNPIAKWSQYMGED
ncbi:hypothetical protein GGR56DRAFT_649751 [Xylariaceae sp. FL0804]|nr:hypothetical protein GGR56DRAFT_649751 [Xylariaceae sp. FL0804]